MPPPEFYMEYVDRPLRPRPELEYMVKYRETKGYIMCSKYSKQLRKLMTIISAY